MDPPDKCLDLHNLPEYNPPRTPWALVELFTHTRLQPLRIVHEHADKENLFGPFNALSLPSLRLLEARYLQSSEISTLFDALPRPNLRWLEFRGRQPWPHEQFGAFLTRSNCPLESLIFGIGTDEQRAEYVALIPSLEVVVDSMCYGR
ncbi:hypothetical protein DFH29DRAFT_1083952 [Suillus ampliporus]|nr:hypothetical protein DFH29DRAFT_1083952 [Suillus ampliporus]